MKKPNEKAAVTAAAATAAAEPKAATKENTRLGRKQKKKKATSFALGSPLADATNFQSSSVRTPEEPVATMKRLPAAGTPAPSRDKRKAATPLSCRSHVCSSPELSASSPTLPADTSGSSFMPEALASPMSEPEVSLAARLARASIFEDQYIAAEEAVEKPPLSPALSTKGSGCAADSETSAAESSATRSSQTRGGGVQRYGEGFYSPATFLRMRPYGGDGKYRGLTPMGKASPVGESGDEAWVEAAEGEDDQSDQWEADGDSNDDGPNTDASQFDNSYATDASVKSGKWCRSLNERIEEAGLTPKAPGVTAPRPAHLR